MGLVLGILPLDDAAPTVLVSVVLCIMVRDVQSIRVTVDAMHMDPAVTPAKPSWQRTDGLATSKGAVDIGLPHVDGTRKAGSALSGGGASGAYVSQT